MQLEYAAEVHGATYTFRMVSLMHLIPNGDLAVAGNNEFFIMDSSTGDRLKRYDVSGSFIQHFARQEDVVDNMLIYVVKESTTLSIVFFDPVSSTSNAQYYRTGYTYVRSNMLVKKFYSNSVRHGLLVTDTKVLYFEVEPTLILKHHYDFTLSADFVDMKIVSSPTVTLVAAINVFNSNSLFWFMQLDSDGQIINAKSLTMLTSSLRSIYFEPSSNTFRADISILTRAYLLVIDLNDNAAVPYVTYEQDVDKGSFFQFFDVSYDITIMYKSDFTETFVFWTGSPLGFRIPG